MYVHVHGDISPDVLMYGSVLFLDRRVGDVTVWYQSSSCSMDLWAMKDQIGEEGYLLPSKDQRTFTKTT